MLCGWSLAGLPRLVIGDPDVDDDGGDGREDIASDDEGDAESEIETEESDEDEDMDVDGKEDEGRRYGPIIGGGRQQGLEKTRDSQKDRRRS